MNAAQRLKEVRNVFSMNQTRLAETLGVSTAVISQMESGKANRA